MARTAHTQMNEGQEITSTCVRLLPVRTRLPQEHTDFGVQQRGFQQEMRKTMWQQNFSKGQEHLLQDWKGARGINWKARES